MFTTETQRTLRMHRGSNAHFHFTMHSDLFLTKKLKLDSPKRAVQS